MHEPGFDASSRQALEDALREKGFSLAPALPASPQTLRAIRGKCEVHFHREECQTAMRIPVVLLGPDRPLTPLLGDYLAGRNKARKGPGAFAVEEDVVWYRASAPHDDPSAVAATALAMQQAVEKTGPKILNLLR